MSFKKLYKDLGVPRFWSCFYHQPQQHKPTTISALHSPKPLPRHPISTPITTSNLNLQTPIINPIFSMAASTSFTTEAFVNYGRSGYNKGNSEDDEENKFSNFGRSGYNKGDDDDEENKFRNYGRSGYNKENDKEEDDK